MEPNYDNPLAARESVEDTFLSKYNWQGVDVEKDLLDFAEPYSPPRYTLRRHDVPFANVGELHIISGKPGHGKTGLMSMLIASILAGKYGDTEYALGAERPKPVVLYIDTEQGRDDTIAFKNRVCTMAGIDYAKPCEQFHILRLRDTEDAVDRWRKTLKAVWMIKPTDIFLDGVLDIVKDYNDQTECQPIVRDCMMLADKFDSSFWVVLHENPLVDKLVGVLGSIFQRKVAEIFTLRKVKQKDQKLTERNESLPPIYFIVKQVKARGKDVDDFMFEYTTNTAGWGIPSEIHDLTKSEQTDACGKEKEDSRRPTDEVIRQALAWMNRSTHTFTYIREKIRTTVGCGSTRARLIIEVATLNGFLVKDENKYTPTDKLFSDALIFESEKEEKDPF